jgi:hypothetical protein
MIQIRALSIVVALLVLAALFMPGTSLAQAADEQCFAQTGQCLSGRFLEYWEQNGGLAVFGYPITPARSERNPDTGQTYLTQWFERNRFELHPENAAPYDVLLGRLGDGLLRQRGIDWQALPRESGPKPGCLWFEATGHNVCDQADGVGFRIDWLSHGLDDPRLDDYQQSLALFGYPLTEARQETNSSGDTVLTQWFERARFEWHPDKPHPYKVLLGLLGNEASGTPTRPLKYFWPTTIPRDLVVQPEQSFAGETAFALELAEPSGGQFRATITGGPGSVAVNRPPEQGSRAVTVRGQPGVAFTTGAGYAVYWTEDHQPYAIVSGLGLADVLTLAEGLEALDLATWRQRLAGAG